MQLRQQIVSGVAWSVAGRIGTQVIGIIVSMALSRLLAPEAFGTIAMTAVFTGFASLYASLGLGSALIQRRDLQQAHRDTAFLVNVAVGAVITTILFMVAPLIARFYSSPMLGPITRVLSLTFLIGSFAIVPYSLLAREMNFKALARLDLASAVLPATLAIVMAIQGHGVWSLVASALSSSALRVALLWRVSGWRPGFRFEMRAVRDLMGFSAGLLGFNTVNYWSRNLDDLLIGRIVGAASLGLYHRAYLLMMLPISQIIGVIAPVMFPALSSIQADTKRVRRTYLKAIGMITFATFPAVMGLFVVAADLIPLMYGEQWDGVVPILRVLCGVSLIQSVTNPTGWIYMSQAKTNWMMWWGLGSSAVTLAAFIIGAHIGTTMAITWAYLVANVVLLYPAVTIPGRLIGIEWPDIVRVVRAPLGCAGAMAAGVYGLGFLLAGNPPALKLAIQVTAGGLAYLLLVRFLGLQSYYLVYEMVDRRLGRWSRAALWRWFAPREHASTGGL